MVGHQERIGMQNFALFFLYDCTTTLLIQYQYQIARTPHNHT